MAELTVKKPAGLIWRSFQNFSRLESASGIILILCALIALVWANSAWAPAYHHLKEYPLGFVLAGVTRALPFELIVNDALMALFFFLVGLEIKREMLAGELASLKQSALPIAGALGGMIVPALIFFAWNRGLPSADGWGIPMATDIAFALGVLTLLGKRIPLGIKVFLVALAIIDDIGAILVIAFFYTSQIHLLGLYAALVVLAGLVVMNLRGVKHPAPYLLGGALLWIGVFQSGIHATIAGVALAFCIPHKPKLREEDFAPKAADAVKKFHSSAHLPGPILDDGRVAAIHELEGVCEAAEPMLQRFESKLHPWVSFGILPLFALTNAGVEMTPTVLHMLREPLGLGILMGLCLGKPFGITVFSWLAVRFKLASMPTGITWVHMAGAGILGGIGFTMSIFISGLGLPSRLLLDGAKVAILAASLIAGLLGYMVLRIKSGRA